jgi:histidine triad (HIT) family protein
MGADCIFCGIVAGNKAFRVLEDDACVAFLDVKPLFPGHVLLVPRRHVETLGDLTEDEVGPLFARVRRMAKAVEGALQAGGTFVAMNNKVSQSVPHLHVHVVPRKKGDGLKGFFWPRTKYPSEAEAEAVAAKIRAALAVNATETW